MKEIVVDGTLEGWRDAAREFLTSGFHPCKLNILSSVDAQQGGLFAENNGTFAKNNRTSSGSSACSVDSRFMTPDLRTKITISKRLWRLLESAACFRDKERWNLFYRIVWRINFERKTLLDDFADSDIHRLMMMDKAIHREVHKMHAFVRFRKVGTAKVGTAKVETAQVEAARECEETFIAWFEPQHDVVMRALPFFIDRFPSMNWTILTPYISVYWNQENIEVGPGVSKDKAPDGDALEELWSTYYKNIFNPARLNTRAMLNEMPKRYWSNLPEASLIPKLVKGII